MPKLFVLPLTLLFLAISLFSFPSGATPSVEPTDSFLISHVNLIPMDSSEVLPDRFVLVEHGRISRVANSEIPRPSSAKTIDGRGILLIGSLADLHVRLCAPDDFPAYV